MVFMTRGLYGSRKWSHHDLYEKEHLWYFLELGRWTVELDLNEAKWSLPSRLTLARLTIAAAALLHAFTDIL